VKTASEYREQARQCRLIAASMENDAHREQLLAMAAKWEELADARLQEPNRTFDTKPATPPRR
jgi:hypothetical protein